MRALGKLKNKKPRDEAVIIAEKIAKSKDPIERKITLKKVIAIAVHPGGRRSFHLLSAGVGRYPWLWVTALGVSLLAFRRKAIRLPSCAGFCRLPPWLAYEGGLVASIGCLAAFVKQSKTKLNQGSGKLDRAPFQESKSATVTNSSYPKLQPAQCGRNR